MKFKQERDEATATDSETMKGAAGPARRARTGRFDRIEDLMRHGDAASQDKQDGKSRSPQ